MRLSSSSSSFYLRQNGDADVEVAGRQALLETLGADERLEKLVDGEVEDVLHEAPDERLLEFLDDVEEVFGAESDEDVLQRLARRLADFLKNEQSNK